MDLLKFPKKIYKNRGVAEVDFFPAGCHYTRRVNSTNE